MPRKAKPKRGQPITAPDGKARTQVIRFRVSRGESMRIALRAVAWGALRGCVQEDPAGLVSEYLRVRALGDD